MLRWFKRHKLGSLDARPPGGLAAIGTVSWPDNVRRLATREDVAEARSQERAIVYFTVDWSSQERQSRCTFTDFVQRVENEYRHLGICFWVLGEACESIAELFDVLKVPAGAAAGYGAVVWLERGVVVGSVENAAVIVVDGVLSRTLGLWQP